MMTWREAFLLSVGPAGMAGVTLGDWLRLLCVNRFAVSPRYWPRAATVTAVSMSNSVLRRLEDWRYGAKVRATQVKSPLFILGVWRSGTTHLHNLLARDARFAYPNFYQVIYPHTFLLTEKSGAKMLNLFSPKKRFQDNVVLGAGEPQEDEFALCVMTGLSILMGLAFPRNWAFYNRYLTMNEATEDERRRWKSALVWFLKKLTFKHGRPLVLKSPAHTCRIKLLLELFPDAKFVNIHRHPYEVIQSSLHTVRKVTPAWAFQRRDFSREEDETFEQYKALCDEYFAQRSLIPPDRLHELGFEDLERDPLGKLRETYRALDLPDFGDAELAVQAYVDSLAGYKKNVFPELPERLRRRIAEEWGRSFDEWGYPR
jgi:hypothetical protein